MTSQEAFESWWNDHYGSEYPHQGIAWEAWQASCADTTAERDSALEDLDREVRTGNDVMNLLAAANADAKQADEFTHKALDERDHYLRQLEAAQAREQVLREALQRRMSSENRWPDYIIEALALPTDHAALDARLKEYGVKLLREMRDRLAVAPNGSNPLLLLDKWTDELEAGK